MKFDASRRSVIETPESVGLSEEINEEHQILWDHLGLEYESAEWKKAFDAKLACSHALRDVNLKQEKMRREILSQGVRELYIRLTHNWKGPEYFTTLEAYNILYQNKEPSESLEKEHRLLALHNFLLADSEHFVADSVEFLHSARFRLRAKEELTCLRRVRAWIRTGAPEIEAFKKKSRKINDLVEKSRKGTHLTAAEPNQKLGYLKVPDMPSWSEPDLAIIQFLRYSLDMKRKTQVNPFEAYAAILVKTIYSERSRDGEDDSLGAAGQIPPSAFIRVAILRFLKSVGVFPEWDNIVIRQRELGLEEWTKQLDWPADVVAAADQHSDQLDSVRHDFGHLPVYTIDEASASELDDGISIETCPSLLDSLGLPTYWVHIHVADPTCTLQPNDPLSLQARVRQSTLYFPEMTWSMLPFSVIQKNGWSLGSPDVNSQEKEQKVLTFSARMDQEAGIFEQRIRVGIIRNVQKVTYDAVDDLLDGKDAQTAHTDTSLRHTLTWPTLGATSFPSLAPPALPSKLTGSAKEDLTQLRNLSRMLLRQRVSSSALQWNHPPSSFLVIQPRPILPQFSTWPHPLFHSRAPSLQLTLPCKTTRQGLTPSQTLVSEFMILAGRISASYLAERKIPAPFRGQEQPKVDKPGVLEELLSLRNAASGEIDVIEIFKRKVQFQQAYFSLTPVTHWPMGIRASTGGYVRSTSPLRRYGDMVAHWQIKSTLGPQARQQQKPPFSYEEVQGMVGEMERTSHVRTRMERRARLFWKLYLLEQKLRDIRQDPGSDPFAAELLLNGLTAVVGQTRVDFSSLQRIVNVNIPELGVPAILTIDPRIGDIFGGRRLKIDIVGIVLDDFSKLYVKMKQVGCK